MREPSGCTARRSRALGPRVAAQLRCAAVAARAAAATVRAARRAQLREQRAGGRRGRRGPPATPDDGPSEALRRAWGFLWDEAEPALRRRTAAALMLMVGAKLTVIQVPFLFKHAIDGLAIDPSAAALLPDGVPLVVLTPPLLMVAYGAARAAAEGMAQLRSSLFASVTEAAAQRTAVNTFRHLHAMDLSFHLSRQTGALSRTVERGTKAVGVLLSTTVLHVLPTAFEVSVVSALLYRNCGGAFAATTLATLALYSAFTFGVTRWRTQIRRDQNRAETAAAQSFVDSLINFETVKYFDATAHEERRYDASLSTYRQAALKTAGSLALLNFGQSVIFSGGLATCLVLAAQEVAAGTMTIGDVVMVHGLVFQVSIPLNLLGMVYNQVRQSSTDMAALLKLLGETPAVASAPGAPPLAAAGGSLRFDGVSFGYADDAPPLLKGLSFDVPAGSTLAIVGGSGSGKSTILRLLYRFYDARAGRVLIDGQDVRDVDVDSLRAAIAVVPQDVVLFNESLLYNLRYGRPEATLDEAKAAARLAQLDRAIEGMPKGYDTVVGERGLKLSGGEKQRLAIARALLKKAPILLCDEATSAVDTVTEHAIFTHLRDATRDERRTCVMIAHRLSTVVDADRIIVLNKGELAESGTHAELLRLGGEYARMWALQQGEGGPDWTGTTSSLPL